MLGEHLMRLAGLYVWRLASVLEYQSKQCPLLHVFVCYFLVLFSVRELVLTPELLDLELPV